MPSAFQNLALVEGKCMCFRRALLSDTMTFPDPSSGLGFQELCGTGQEQAGAHPQIHPAMGSSRMTGQFCPQRSNQWTFCSL